MFLGGIDKNTVFFVEESAFLGVKRVAEKVCKDVEKVTGKKPVIVDSLKGLDPNGTQVILCATVGKSAALKQLEWEKHLDISSVSGKWEVYGRKLLQDALGGFEVLVIYGSDKRGTIYGMFSFSEYIGVSPLCFWGDVRPVRKEVLAIDKQVDTISREPSVKYRGFFINDEWPCFGNWVFSHFGGFNAEAYDHVFEFLLRMKGNYLWPAMWSSSFPLDGPGSKNEELADIYGVVIGYSHHEPCLRASEEWDKVRGPKSRYGNEWNFYTNEQGLLNYWEDALKRSGKYENMITIGMRGERDSSLLKEHANLEENIRLLKDIILKQRQLIKKNVNENLSKVPQLLVLYKEVEAYFYGDENIKGLKDWEELDDVICMFCEDNFGNMRTLPTEKIRNHKGGFGMYYHLDYHGGPISYEWVDSTPLSKIWEQMSMAYEYGIRKVWIVNVGDIKFHEVPLTYFLALAYDYDKWGYGNRNSYREYTVSWVEKNFPSVSPDIQKKIGKVLTDYIDINSLRRPEALNSKIYHPCHYNEAERMIAKAIETENLSTEIYNSLNGIEKEAYYSMIHFSAMASMNLLKMHLYAGKNAFYAKQGKTIANQYADMVRKCIAKDRALCEELGNFKNGKWNGMHLAQHIGFTKWNEDDCRYPVIMTVEPANKPRLKVNRKDSFAVATKTYGAPMSIQIDDFCYAGCDQVVLEIANDGIGSVHFWIEPQTESGTMPAWLKVSSMEGTVLQQEDLVITCDRSRLPETKEQVRLLIKDEETCVAVDITAKGVNVDGLPEKTYLEQAGIITMNADGFYKKKDTKKGSFELMEGYGKYGAGVKVFPSTAVFTEKEEKPFVYYRFLIEEAGEYMAELIVAPTNSVVYKKSVNVVLQINNKEQKVEVLPADFKAGDCSDEDWNKGVLNQERSISVQITLEEGVQSIGIGALEAGFILERIILYKRGIKRKEAYLGPYESWFTS